MIFFFGQNIFFFGEKNRKRENTNEVWTLVQLGKTREKNSKISEDILE
jgi:hypothetical protein